AEVERLKQKIEDDRAKLRLAEQRLKEAENTQILTDVGALNLTPEQLAQFLEMVKSGQLNGAAPTSVSVNSTRVELPDEDEDFEEYEREELEDED
ncbi:MAG: DUF4315 family protein, partial [Pseudobutyrivibrio sp.]|nr:DUF4315 family protein [Pseudobutyrivibrio sp.]